MSGRYEFPFGPDTVYGNVVRLIEEIFGSGECVLDLGCGYGAIAEPCRSLGYTYIGLDQDVDSVKAVRDRGFEAYEIDLLDIASLGTAISEAVGDRSLAGVVMLDTLEHLTEGGQFLAALRSALSSREIAPLVLSVPNVTHLEIGAKLLQGRWDVTKVGLLDDTHVSFFSAERLDNVLRGAGWLQVAERDFRLIATDQRFPADDVALLEDTPLHQLLRKMRLTAEPTGTVNQFVRAFLPGPVKVDVVSDQAERPFLTVLIRTQGKRAETLQESLLCLAAQDCTDFECLVLAHDVEPDVLGDVHYLVDTLPLPVRGKFRVVPVIGGGRSRPLNVGVAESRGRYIAILDDDDLVFAHWVGEFRELSRQRPGRVLRAGVVVQEAAHGRWMDRQEYRNIGGFRAPYPSEFDLLRHLSDNSSPPCGLAFPVSCFRDLGIRFDEELPVLEDWDVLLQAAVLCGVVCTPEVTSVYRWWQKSDSSLQRHSQVEWQSSRSAVLRRMDAVPLLLPAGSASTIRELLDDGTTVRARLESAEQQLAEAQARLSVLTAENDRLRSDYEWLTDTARQANSDNQQRFHELTQEFYESSSWRVSAPMRAAATAMRFRNRHRARSTPRTSPPA